MSGLDLTGQMGDRDVRLNKLSLAGASCAMALVFGVGAANATTFNFNVIYTGADTAVLAPGSDDMLGVVAMNGDIINYSFSAGAGQQWTTLQAGGPSIFGSVGDLYGDFGPVSFNYAYAFNLGGVAQASGSGSASQGNADLGPRQVTFPGGMNFDNFFETLTITGASQDLTFLSLLPAWPAHAPEFGAPDYFSYGPAGAAVPEPASWAMMLVGFGGLGAALRRRRSQTAIAAA